MALYHEWCFTELHKIMVNKITFVGFRGAIAPIAPPLVLRTLEGTLLAGFPVQQIAT